MAEVQIMTGNQAAALGAKLSHVQVVAAYPITPQTSVTEMLSQSIEGGELKAEYIRVESEHSALAVCISASTVGARVFTSTSSQGLLYMHEIEPTLRKAPIIKVVPMIGSLGCPYTCSFCIDSEIPYQPLDFDLLKRDLRSTSP